MISIKPCKIMTSLFCSTTSSSNGDYFIADGWLYSLFLLQLYCQHVAIGLLCASAHNSCDTGGAIEVEELSQLAYFHTATAVNINMLVINARIQLLRPPITILLIHQIQNTACIETHHWTFQVEKNVSARY